MSKNINFDLDFLSGGTEFPNEENLKKGVEQLLEQVVALLNLPARPVKLQIVNEPDFVAHTRFSTPTTSATSRATSGGNTSPSSQHPSTITLSKNCLQPSIVAHELTHS